VSELETPWEIAARQHGVVRSSQLGMSTAGIAKWVRAGRIHPLYRGVYAYGHAALSERGGWMAVLLAAGDGATLTGSAGGRLLGVMKRPVRIIDVLVPKPRRSQPGFRAHTCRGLDERDVVVVDGLRVATVARLLVDLTESMEADELALVIHEAAYLGKFSREATVAALDRANGRRRVKVLEAALALHASGSAGSRSRLEKRFRRLVVGAGLPAPRQNVKVNGFEVDAYWPGLCVEIDGVGHRRARTAADDRIRDAALRAAGYTVLRFAEDDLDARPAWVLAQLAAQELPRRVARQ
jgi:very-short-patch-repair endonuclease